MLIMALEDCDLCRKKSIILKRKKSHRGNMEMVFNEQTVAAGYTQSLRKCYCEGHCPYGQVNGTCELRPGGVCFAAVEAVIGDDDVEYPYRTFGCFAPEEGGLMQCRGDRVPHTDPKSIQCCNDTDLCNRDLRPMYRHHPTPDPPDFSPFENPTVILLLTTVTFCLTFSLIVIAIVYLKCRRKSMLMYQGGGGAVGGGTQDLNQAVDKSALYFAVNKYQSDALDGGDTIHHPLETRLIVADKSSSGGGVGVGTTVPVLSQRTISKQLQMVEVVGKGRFGEVWLARWRGERVAVKIFYPNEEQSWYRESTIYQTVMMRHDNILGFIGADLKGAGAWSQMLLITDYHAYGSLYEYLQGHVLDTTSLVVMAVGIASGLCHLHTEIFGTRGKPAIAHRDLKTKNILVKRSGECCIGDFGLAVKYSSDTNELDEPRSTTRTSTKRYMAPELLNRTLDLRHFGGYKMADMYAFALILWEMTHRCMTRDSKLTSVDQYQMPYYEYAPKEPPTTEEMYQIVCVKHIRPVVPSRWDEDVIMRTVAKIMQECWHYNPSVRLTALRVKKTLTKLGGTVDTNNCIKIV